MILDTYRRYPPHGAPCFTRNDPTKLHPSPPYPPPYLPKNILPPQFPRKSQLQLPYPIPLPQPLSISIHTFPTPKLTQYQLLQPLTKHFHLTPPPIIKILHLKHPI
ncbi:methionine adenosyltransferase domain-containing protein, partial [Staphylococcus saprophyticus]|uniref:methionine adenosyltransferase domain-containing protein n=1 Tax=Staphylococcus saprophyticus TaxID=29385 RepID=UPI0037048258